MTTTAQNDDNTPHPQMPLHGWLPVTEIAEHLGMKKGTVYSAVINAAKLKQDWVKQDRYPYPGGPRRWLINTDSEIFQYHERRWKRQMEKYQERMSTIPLLPDFPWSKEEDENPLDQEEKEDTTFPFDWQTPFAFPLLPPPPLPTLPKVSQAQEVLWKRGTIELSLLVLLQLVTIACIVKRIPEQDKSD